MLLTAGGRRRRRRRGRQMWISGAQVQNSAAVSRRRKKSQLCSLSPNSKWRERARANARATRTTPTAAARPRMASAAKITANRRRRQAAARKSPLNGRRQFNLLARKLASARNFDARAARRPFAAVRNRLYAYSHSPMRRQSLRLITNGSLFPKCILYSIELARSSVVDKKSASSGGAAVCADATR